MAAAPRPRMQRNGLAFTAGGVSTGSLATLAAQWLSEGLRRERPADWSACGATLLVEAEEVGAAVRDHLALFCVAFLLGVVFAPFLELGALVVVWARAALSAAVWRAREQPRYSPIARRRLAGYASE